MDLSSLPKFKAPWWLIVVAFFLPGIGPMIGIALLFLRLNSDKKATFKDGKTVFTIAYIMMAVGVFLVASAFSGRFSVGQLIWGILLGAGGVWAFRVAQGMKASGERYKKYIAVVVNQSETSIDLISSSVGVTYEQALQDLQKMINLGYFEGAYINEAAREIILAQAKVQPATAGGTPAPVKVTSCGSCGANNKVVQGQFGECEYRGSPLA